MRDDIDLLIVGRGPTAYRYGAWWRSDIMAVSSGIFALPEGVAPKHFVTIDSAHFFNSPVNDHRIAWQNDPQARHWPFWSDAGIAKHVSEVDAVPGRYRPFPMQRALEATRLANHPDKVKAALLENFDWIQNHYGHIPNWGDYSGIVPWRVVIGAPPRFDCGSEDRIIGNGGMRNSVFTAVQVAARLGYRRIGFVGVFDGEGYEQHRERLAAWYPQALAAGVEWFNIDGGSMLGSVLPTLAAPQLETV